MTASARQRLFFALWPDADARNAFAQLARAHQACGRGRPVAAENIHLTLEFLGAVEARFRLCAERAAQSLSIPAFELEFNRLGHWPRPRVLWSAPERTPQPLASLVTTLRKALVECGHEPDSRQFRAHVTLARKVRGPVDATLHTPVCWPVSQFYLMASESTEQGVRYRPLNRWPLG
jgi:2'-5' RNA ligase